MFLILAVPFNLIVFMILLLYSFDQNLAKWSFYLVFQQLSYYVLSTLLAKPPKKGVLPFLVFLCAQLSIGLLYYHETYLVPAKLAALVSGSCIIFLCLKRRKKVAFIIAFLLYFIISCGIGMASRPNGNHCPFFIFAFFHLFFFAGVFIFQKSIPPKKRQPLISFFFAALVYFLPYLPNLEWLEKWICGLDLLLLFLGIINYLYEEEGDGEK